MSNSLTRSLYHLMRGASRPTSLSRLKQRGHKRVSILRYRDIEMLIDTSVENTLSKMGIELSDRDIKGLGAEARVEFLALLHERDSLRETVDDLVTQQEELEANRAVLKERLTETKSELDEEQAAEDEELVEFGEDLTSLEGRISASLRALLSDSATPRDALTARAIELVRAAFDEQREEVANRTRAEQAERVGLLQRRLSKLNKKLEESEAMLARARAAANTSDEDIEEFDMGPAGLKSQDPQFEKKKQVLEEIFKLNVELKSMVDSEGDKKPT